METVIAIAALVLVLGVAVWYIVRSKKKGRKCIGCPGCSEGGCCGCQNR
jgi:hypothetical protein